MRDAQPLGRRLRPLESLTTIGLAFSFFRKKEPPTATPATTRRVVVQGAAPPPPPPAPEPQHPLRSKLIYHELHEEINPAANVRVSTMTCPSCTTQFRIFLNSDGKTTIVKCPSCARTYRA